MELGEQHVVQSSLGDQSGSGEMASTGRHVLGKKSDQIRPISERILGPLAQPVKAKKRIMRFFCLDTRRGGVDLGPPC